MDRFFTGQVIYALASTDWRDLFTRRKNASTPKKDENYYDFVISKLLSLKINCFFPKRLNMNFTVFRSVFRLTMLMDWKSFPKFHLQRHALQINLNYTAKFYSRYLLWNERYYGCGFSSFRYFVLHLHKAFSVPACVCLFAEQLFAIAVSTLLM